MSPRQLPDPAALAGSLMRGERSAVASALNLLDDQRPAARDAAIALLSALEPERLARAGHLIGITGPPGAGKSSLTSALIDHWCSQQLRIAVLAVDPSSPSTGGALLGDRLRMTQAGQHKNLFIRSLASRNQLGGVAAEVWPMSQVMLAAFDVVLVETVGVGQSEVDIANLVDTTVYVVQPASGDSIQFIKSGIMEVPDMMVVNKADLGTPAIKAANDLKQVVRRNAGHGLWTPPVCSVSARDRQGIEDFVALLDRHRSHLLEQGLIATGRRSHQAAWVLRQLRDEFGRWGLQKLGGQRNLEAKIMALGSSGEVMTYYHQSVRVLRGTL